MEQISFDWVEVSDLLESMSQQASTLQSGRVEQTGLNLQGGDGGGTLRRVEACYSMMMEVVHSGGEAP